MFLCNIDPLILSIHIFVLLHHCSIIFCISSGNEDIAGDRPGGFTLEQNHTHYIFFDDGTHNSIDTGGFISRLARHISSKAGRRSEFLKRNATFVTIHIFSTTC